MRLVLDTNILISAFFWDGKERELLLNCREKIFQSITSPGIIEEMEEKLESKFQVPQDKISEYVQDLIFMSELVFTKGTITIVKEDPDDNIIIETAILGKADAIITGDKHLLKLKKHKGILISKTSELIKN